MPKQLRGYHITYRPGKQKVCIVHQGQKGNPSEESEDRSDEAVRAVMAHMKQKLAAQMTTKPWFGYRDRELGQLVFIENGHGFKVL